MNPKRTRNGFFVQCAVIFPPCGAEPIKAIASRRLPSEGDHCQLFISDTLVEDLYFELNARRFVKRNRDKQPTTRPPC